MLLSTAAITVLSFSVTVVSVSGVVNSETQAEAVNDLLQRLIPDHVHNFVISVKNTKGYDSFQISSSGGKIYIEGTTGVAAAWGVQHYLKYWCNADVSWSGDQLNLTDPLPTVEGIVKVSSPYRYRYYQNVCTSSYSFVWWDWTRWQREIDWMALNGINLPLAFTGQEEILRRVFSHFNFTSADLASFFSGPAFLAWYRMGNIQGWGGPLPEEWMFTQLQLQHLILTRMRSFGMMLVLPGFAGHVPSSITRLYPNASVHQTMTKGRTWGHFSHPYCCTYLLDPTDSLFREITHVYMSELIQEFGTDHFYSVDLFNELSPKSNDTEYLHDLSAGVFTAMSYVDPATVWVMQGWLFQNDEEFWQPPQTKSLLLGVLIGRFLILDLFAEVYPQWQRTESFYGQPFIWCMLHNFGGNLGMYGTVENVTRGPVEALDDSKATIVGTGLTPEGIEQNDVVYELMNEMGWRTQPVNLASWIVGYARRRYGGDNTLVSTAWLLLFQSIYNSTISRQNHCHAIPVVRPALDLNPPIWYNISHVYEAWDLMVRAAPKFAGIGTFRYDLVDLTRQALQDFSIPIYKQLVNEYNNKSATGVRNAGNVLLELLRDMDRVLLTDKHFLLGRWLNSAKARAVNHQETVLYEVNARNQITLWGPHGELHDYANKMWAGLVSDYYTQRWAAFVDQLEVALTQNQAFNATKFESLDVAFGLKWTTATNSYPDRAQGDTVSVVQELHKKYRPHLYGN